MPTELTNKLREPELILTYEERCLIADLLDQMNDSADRIEAQLDKLVKLKLKKGAQHAPTS